MGSVASDLKSERQKRNISLAQIAADTRISLHYLESLEEGRYNELPGGMYNRAFLRAYCERLNLNQQEILGRYEAEISPPMDKILKSRISVHQKNTVLRPNSVIIWSLMLLISATGLFFSRKWISAVFSPYFSRKPAVTISPEIRQPPPPVAKIQTPNSAVAPVTAPEVSGQAVPAQAVPGQSADPDRAARLADSVPTNAAANSDSPVPAARSTNAPLRLEIGISEQCWVSIDRDGNPAVRRLMDPGEVQSLDANEQFLLIVGNAGGAHLKINGKPAKILGKSGEVVKILIDAKNLQDLLDQSAG
ncbi:MAG: helix-turn-helix domain-containing protein [Acidobacteria bacterium]|nr:helix-turn-helix domain-containing protein [Acidobacteriota bacterium]